MSSNGRRFFSGVLAAAILALHPVGLDAAITGTVVEMGTTTGIVGAIVQVQAEPGTRVTTGAGGSFSVAPPPGGPFTVTAALPYQKTASVNYLIGSVGGVVDGAAIVIELEVLPVADDPGYEPPLPNFCGNCHSERLEQWESSHHAFTAQNSWVLDLYSGTGTAGGGAGYVFRDTHDPGETGFCAACHAPMRDRQDPGNVMLDEVTQNYGLQGVICVTCHQMDAVDATHLNNLNHVPNGGNTKTSYRTPLSGSHGPEQFVWGPLPDISFEYMRASYSTLHQSSLICASCHQYHNPDTDAPGQNTYQEWLDSDFAKAGPGFRSCQDCHMPTAPDDGTVCDAGPVTRDGGERHAHTWIGSTLATLQANVGLATTIEQSAPDRVRVRSEVDNFGAGHSFPTGISIRNAILHITASIGGMPLVQVSGPTIPFWGSDDVPGDQPGDLAGQPGKGFAKVLEGRINGAGPVVRPVLFIDAEAVYSDTLIPSGAVDVTEVEFELPPGTPPGAVVDVTAVLLHRRGWRSLVVTKGWTVTAHGDPIELEVGRNTGQLTVTGVPVQEIPALGPAGVAAIALALAFFGAVLLAGRRRARG